MMVSPDISQSRAEGRDGSKEASVRTEARWFGPDDRPLLAWLSAPEAQHSKSGVLILAPIGYPYWSSHRTLRVLSERLAANGHLAMRFDYESTGDSAEEQWNPDRLSAWRASARAAVDELRGLGVRRLALVGVRLGATLALLDAAEWEADSLVAWSPVLSGSRYAKEIRMLSQRVPQDAGPLQQGALVSAGTVFTDQTLNDISALNVAGLTSPPAARVLLVDSVEQDKLADHMSSLGVEFEQAQMVGSESALESPTEYATVPEEIVKAICSWIGPAAAEPGAPSPGRALARLPWGDSSVTERIVQLGTGRLVGILTEPETAAPTHATVVFLNSGSEPHIGPGRAWVEYARALALLGYRCLRVDFRGWGESPDDGYAPGRPYDLHCEQDTIAIVHALRELGHRQIVLVGLCASAWIALRAILKEPVAGVVALNPQLYWRRGDPVEATMQETRARRADERRVEQRGGHYRLWSFLDLVGHRPWAARWLDDLCSAETPVSMVFAEGDDGIEYLRNRLRRRLALVQRRGGVHVIEVPKIDHSMHLTWLRAAHVAVLNEQIHLCLSGRSRADIAQT